MSSDTKTVMHIIPALVTGGAELLLLSICEGLRKKYPALSIVIVVLYKSRLIESRPANDKLTIIPLNLDKYRFLHKIIAVYKCIIKIKPDIVHTHLIPADRYGLIAAFLAGVKYRVTTAHSQQIDPILSDQITPYLFWFLATNVIAVSEAVKRNYVKYYYLLSAKISVIYSAPSYILTNIISPKQHPGANAPFKIVLVANCKPAKGQLILIKAFKENRPQYSCISIDIYGDYSSEYGKQCVEEINNSTTVLPITLKGRIDNVSDVLFGYHLMISTSFWEGFPLSMVEGMITGLPIVATDIAPHREIFGSIDNFPFVKVGSPADLFSMINKVVSEPYYYNYLSKMNLQRAADFTQDKMIDNYNRFYNLLGK
jgi:glycosyltransferase involved in cell wall biosynthesis